MDTLPAYFRERIEVQEGGCWLWIGPRRNGYGSAFTGYGPLVNGKTATTHSGYAHREVYRRLRPEVAIAGLDLHHKLEGCPKLCVNPDHLEPKTPSAHHHDHQQARRAKLTPDELAARKELRRVKACEAVRRCRERDPVAWRAMQKRSEARCRDARNARRRERGKVSRKARRIAALRAAARDHNARRKDELEAGHSVTQGTIDSMVTLPVTYVTPRVTPVR